ncbi:MAG: DUF3108 domain-containing protein [candidate division Zixibacteria bacterium]|nr:DUF3108 domain-containing protein [candidate division Zixibacteria bacterium]
MIIRPAVARIAVITLAAGLLAIGGYFVHAQYGAAQGTRTIMASPLDTVPAAIDRYVENVAFGVGERFNFDIGYGFINAGSATMEVVDLIEYTGRPAYRIVTTAESNKFFSSFYPVSDRVESIMDAVGLFSWQFQKILKEGKYRAERQYAIDQINHKVVYKNDTITVQPYVQDVLSALYFIRTQPLTVGKAVFVDNFTDGKNYPLEVKVHRKEKIKTKAGEFDCLVVEPLLQSAGVFKHEGKLTVWLTDDRLRMPVMMKSKVVVGSITAELTDFKLGRLEEF